MTGMRAMLLRTFLAVLLAGAVRVAVAAVSAAQPSGTVALETTHVVQEVEAVLRARWAPGGERLDVVVEPFERGLRVLPGELSVQATLSPGLGLRSRMPVSVRVASGDKAVASLVVWVQVRLWKPVLRTREPLARDTILAADMLETVEVDVASLGGVPAVEHPAGRSRLRLALPAGTVLLQRHVTTLAMVARNDLVRLHSRRGGIALETEAVAVGDAPLGGTVAVRPSGSLQTLPAVVVGPRTVVPKD